MVQAFMNLLSLCAKPVGQPRRSRELEQERSCVLTTGGDRDDELLRFHDIGKHGSGEFSMAVVQANKALEDQSQVESGPFGTFVGIYDGHGGPEAARYVSHHLFTHFQGLSFLCFQF